MAPAPRTMRCISLEGIDGGLNPEWVQRLEALVAAGKTEAEAEAQLVTEGVPRTTEPTVFAATFRGKPIPGLPAETLRENVKAGVVEVGHAYTVSVQ